MPTGFIPFSKKGDRKVSSFVGQELLYDYVIGKLDSQRMTAVEEYLKANREAHSELQRIHSGLDYTRLLAGTKVAATIVEEIKAPSSYFQVLLRKLRFEEWSPGIKMGLEVLVVAVGVISVSILIPWHRLMEINWATSREVVLAEVSKSPNEKSSEEIGTANSMPDNAEVFPDDIKDKNGKTMPLPTPATKVVAAAPVAPNSNSPSPAPAPAPTPTKAPPPEVVIPTAPVVAAKSSKEAAKENAQHVGFLYRGSIQVTNVNAISPKFVEKIAELGGRKAGEVELGWKKGNSRYFHLTMPESKYQALLDFAKAYGNLNIAKEKHERVMPEGIVRIIFTVDEKKSP